MNATKETAEDYIVNFTYYTKKGARRVKVESCKTVKARSASEAIGIVGENWKDDKEASWAFTSARSVASLDEEIELKRRERAYAKSPAGQAENGARQLAAIRARREAQK